MSVENQCVCCGETIAEGRQVCPRCESCPHAMRKPVFMHDIKYLGEWYWCEIEGFEGLARMRSGEFCFLERSIMGWREETLGEIYARRKKSNFAPRIRLWKSENEKDAPTAQERAAGGWSDISRLWYPDARDILDDAARTREFVQTGRTVWEDEGNAAD